MARPPHRIALGLATALCLTLSAGRAFCAPASKPRRPQVSAEKIREAEALVNQATGLYQANRYTEAIALLEKAYRLDPHPTILLNIGRAHNRNGAFEPALHFYRLYLQREPSASDRPQIEERIRQLEEALGLAPASIPAGEAPPPPPLDEPPPVLEPTPPVLPQAATPPPRSQPTTAAPDGPRERDVPTTALAGSGRPVALHPFRMQITPGVALPFFVQKPAPQPPPSIETRPFFALSLAAVYAAPVSFGFVDIGLAGNWSPLQYETTTGARSVLSQLVGGFLTIALRSSVSEHLFVGPSVALGSYWWVGLEAQNPFTTGGRRSDPVPMPTVRFGLPIIGDIGSHLLLGFEPAYGVSKTTGAALSDAIIAVHRFEVNGIFAVVF
ncbi:MAG TPA: tetratricopeptide repeat protein [Polyangia bacterium]